MFQNEYKKIINLFKFSLLCVFISQTYVFEITSKQIYFKTSKYAELKDIKRIIEIEFTIKHINVSCFMSHKKFCIKVQ